MTAPAIKGIYIADVSGDPELGRHRSNKHCVCVSVGAGLYLLINTAHRELYNDFPIKASDYAFLFGVDRFISCHKPKKNFHFITHPARRDIVRHGHAHGHCQN